MAESHSSSDVTIAGNDIPDVIAGSVHIIEQSPHRLVFEIRNGAQVWGPLAATEYRAYAQVLRSRTRPLDKQGPTVQAVIGEMIKEDGAREIRSIHRLAGNAPPPAAHRIDEQTIFVAESDRVPLSHNHTPEGAALAIANDVRERMGRLGSGPITDAEHALIRQAVLERRHLDINIHSRLGLEVPGIAIERLHQIAIAVARDYGIKPASILE